MENKKTFIIFDVMDTLYSPRIGLYKDVKPTLSALKSNNIYLGIISSMTKEDIMEILEIYQITDYFDVIISVYEYSTKKPDPKLINIARTLLMDLRNIKVGNKEIYYVGDRPDVDVRMANLAGINSVRIIRGKYATKESEGEIEKPKYEIKSLKELGEILNIKINHNKDNKLENNEVEVI